MIDLHSHILPNIDDGSRSLEESIEIIKQAVSNGVTDIIVTPHFILGSSYNKEKKENKKLLAELQEKVKNENIDINYIPKKNEKIEYEWRFNLSKGAIIEDVNDEEKKELIKLVNKVIDVIDLDFVSIDIVKLENNEFKIMEINSGVMMENLINLKEDGEKIAKSIYEIAIQKMFS